MTRLATLASLGFVPAIMAGCSHDGSGSLGPETQRVTGQSTFVSAPLPGTSTGVAGVGGASNFGGSSSGGAAGAAPVAGPTSSSSSQSSASPRTVQETDLYAVEGTRLYYLNSYRGLMVFDISNPDAPALIGRAPIFGDPQEMTVQNNVAVVVVGDWYGYDSGSPFHGSIVRGYDTTDPTNIKVVGEAHLGGYVQDTRVVGNVLYAVSEDFGWEYGWYTNGYGQYESSTPTVTVASVSFAGGVVTQTGYQKFAGTGGVFNVTSSAIMLAFQTTSNDPNDPYDSTQTQLQYVDISDPGGAIKLRGAITVNGVVSGWGPDNGRWNLDFADGTNAHALGCSDEYCGDSTDAYLLQTVSFANPDSPSVTSTTTIADLGWSAAARFVGTRLYLSPSNDYYSPNGASTTTPFSVYDLSNPAAPALAGSTNLNGSVWLYIPDGTKLFSIGNTNGQDSSQVDIQYLDVTNAASPNLLGQSAFGDGWSWTPAADTFKAFTVSDAQGLAVVPFSGWDYNSLNYENGVQILQYSPTGIVSSATAHTKGWVERGIFVGTRLYSMSDEALAVVGYSDPTNPTVIDELTLARNVVNAQPQGSTIAELSSDWWGNDVTTSEMRVLPIANADETTDKGNVPYANIAGVGATTFQNGALAYVVTSVQNPVPCSNTWSQSSPSGSCYDWVQQVQVVDTSNGGAKLRGKVNLPDTPNGWEGWGWWGFWYYDWYNGADIVQVGNDALAFHRWSPDYGYDASTGGYTYYGALDDLVIVDLSNPDAPAVASVTVTNDPTGWWGDLQAIGSTLYSSHYEWVERPDPSAPSGTLWYVRYFLDQIDISDRANPVITAKVNVPGVLVGGSSTDSSILYTLDYRWDSNGNSWDDLDVVKLQGNHAFLQSQTTLDGWVGNVIVQNDVAYTSAQEYDWMANANGTYTQPYMELHQINLTNPTAPVDNVVTSRNDGWGWLLAVEGDRAIITSGWGDVGVDIYKLTPNAAPTFDQFALTLGWFPNSIQRQGNQLFLSSGYWGVQTITLQ
jgi:hypothetical protein